MNRGWEHPCGCGVGVTVTWWAHGEEDPALPTHPGMGWVQEVFICSIVSGKVTPCSQWLLFTDWK